MTDSLTGAGGRGMPTPGAQVREGFALLLQWAGRSKIRRYVFGSAAADLSPTDTALLEYLTRHGPVRLSDLAAQWGVNKSTMTPQVSRLEAKGLIARHPDPADRRATLLDASAAGIELQQRIGEAGAAAFDEILSTWSPEDREALGAMLVRFANDLSAATPRLFQDGTAAAALPASTRQEPERTSDESAQPWGGR